MGNGASVNRRRGEARREFDRHVPPQSTETLPHTNPGCAASLQWLSQPFEPWDAEFRAHGLNAGQSNGHLGGQSLDAAIWAARAEAVAAVDRHTARCNQLWESVMEEASVEGAIWESSACNGAIDGTAVAQASALLREAAISRDWGQLANALAHAKALGFSLGSAKMQQDLDAGRQEEEYELLWRCVAGALTNADRTELSFWIEEARVQKLFVAEPLDFALVLLEEEERRQLKLLKRTSSIQARVAAAHAASDGSALKAFAAEARRKGMDPSAAEAALLGLEEEGSGGEESEDKAAAPPLPPRRPKSTRFRASGHAVRGDEFHDADMNLDEPSSSSRPGSLYRPAQVLPNDFQTARQSAHEGRADATWTKPDSSQGNGRGGSETKGAAGASSSASLPRPPQAPPLNNSSPNLAPHHGPLTRATALACLGLQDCSAPTTEDLRRAYKQAALRWHPDRRQNHDDPEEATRLFQRARASFDLLQSELQSIGTRQAG